MTKTNGQKQLSQSELYALASLANVNVKTVRERLAGKRITRDAGLRLERVLVEAGIVAEARRG